MRVLHVTNGLDADGRFGGVPVVALGLARALQRRGHHVVVASGRTASIRDPDRIEGVRLISTRIRTPFPQMGAGAQFAPFLLLRAASAVATADVVHVHFSRDPTSLTAVLLARLLRRPLVLQTHGMMHAPGNSVGGLLDRLVVPAALAAADAVLVLAGDEQQQVTRLSPSSRAEPFPNGTRAVDTEDVTATADRPDEVLFLARLHPRKGAVAFAEAATSAAQDPRLRATRFIIAGPDEGDRPAVEATIDRAGLQPRFELPGGMSHEAALEALGRCRLFVLPAHDEPFGMTVVEAMMRGTPVVLHESAELAGVVAEEGLGWTFRDDRDLSAVVVTALSDQDELARRGAAARAYALHAFGIDAVTDRLLAVYRRAIDPAPVARAIEPTAAVLDAVERARVVVLVPTFRRPEQVARLLTALTAQTLPPTRVVVCDNDPEKSAQAVCARFDVEYRTESVPGVARVRTRLVDEVRDEDFFAFIDDDEVPPAHWLRTLVLTAEAEAVDVVGAPVVPMYAEAADHWTARFDAHAHGTRPRGHDLVLFPSTNNCLVRSSAWRSTGSAAFDDAFAFTGGEDTDFFWRLRRAGLRLFWEPAGQVEEQVSADRVSTAWFVRRGMQNGFVHGTLLLRDRSPLRVAFSGAARIASGIAMLALAVPRRRSPADGFSRALRGIGFFRAVAGKPTDAYARSASSSA